MLTRYNSNNYSSRKFYRVALYNYSFKVWKTFSQNRLYFFEPKLEIKIIAQCLKYTQKLYTYTFLICINFILLQWFLRILFNIKVKVSRLLSLIMNKLKERVEPNPVWLSGYRVSCGLKCPRFHPWPWPQ